VEANSRLIGYSPDSHDYLLIPLFYTLLWLASLFRFKSPRLPAANEDLTKHLVYFIEWLLSYLCQGMCRYIQAPVISVTIETLVQS
jgi:hypothetical protein